MLQISQISFFQLWIGVLVSIGIRYIVLAYGSYYLFYSNKDKYRKWKIQHEFPSGRMIRFEITQSVKNLIFLGLLSSVVLWMIRSDYHKFYFSISEYGYAYFAFSILVMMIIHDTWFYWAHRLIHHPKLYRWFHAIHHKSVNPTPFASFSMNISELLVEFAIFPLIVLILPLHPSAFLIFVLISFLFNVIGHLGFEIFPQWVLNSWWGKFINTSTKHNIHHRFFNYNYSYYFTFWDKLMSTESPTQLEHKIKVVNY